MEEKEKGQGRGIARVFICNKYEVWSRSGHMVHCTCTEEALSMASLDEGGEQTSKTAFVWR